MTPLEESPPNPLIRGSSPGVEQTQRSSTLLTAQKFAISKCRKAKMITQHPFEKCMGFDVSYNHSQQMTRVTKIVLP